MTANRVERSIRRRRHFGGAAITVSLLAAVLAGCGGVNRSIGSAPPASYESSDVVASQPLALPPNFAALPPSKAETGAQANSGPAQNQWNPLLSTDAAASVAGNSQVTRLPANQTPGEVALLQNAGAQSIDRDVRKKLQMETGLVMQDETMVDSLVLNEPVPSGPGAVPKSEDAQSYALLSATARGAMPAPGASAQPAVGAPTPGALQAPPGLTLPKAPAQAASVPAAPPPPGLTPAGVAPAGLVPPSQPTAAAQPAAVPPPAVQPPAVQSPSGVAPPSLPTAAAPPPATQSRPRLVLPNLSPSAAPSAQSPPPMPSAPAVQEPSAVFAASPPPAAGPSPRTLPPAQGGKEVTWGSGQRPPWLDEPAKGSAPEVAPATVSATVPAPIASELPAAAVQSAPAAEPADDANVSRSTGDLQNLFD